MDDLSLRITVQGAVTGILTNSPLNGLAYPLTLTWSTGQTTRHNVWDAARKLEHAQLAQALAGTTDALTLAALRLMSTHPEDRVPPRQATAELSVNGVRQGTVTVLGYGARPVFGGNPLTALRLTP